MQPVPGATTTCLQHEEPNDWGMPVFVGGLGGGGDSYDRVPSIAIAIEGAPTKKRRGVIAIGDGDAHRGAIVHALQYTVGWSHG